MRTPNDVLRSWRISQRLSQDELARRLRETGQAVGYPNGASKRLVQRWESGTTKTCRPVYARALEAIAGVPVEALGFGQAISDGRGGHDVVPDQRNRGTEPISRPQTGPVPGNYTGIWLSRYEYYSSSRDGTFLGLHHVVVLQHGNRLTVRSLPNACSSPGSTLTMAMEVDRNIATGTWREETSPTGYYAGAVYHGAIQILIEPTGRRMTGKWLGFGKEFDINTGPWELAFRDASTSQATLDAYSRPPENG